ncbi:MAG: ComF family protein [Acidobacteriota bacterium]|nr:ComF family protein [Acidobacteriota bacterium]
MILDLVLPTDCFGCGRPLDVFQIHGACLACWSSLATIRAPWCPACGAPRPAGTDLLGPARGRCADCLLRSPMLDGVRAAVEYDALARRFVLRAKFGGRRELYGPMGRHLGRLLDRGAGSERWAAIVPVPAHPWTELRRGFNPALEIARSTARVVGVPVRAGWLRRRLARPRAVKRLDPARRRRVLADVFVGSRRAAGHRVLLMDDVYTTGATAEACGEALRAAGAESVWLGVWARTPLRVGGL